MGGFPNLLLLNKRFQMQTMNFPLEIYRETCQTLYHNSYLPLFPENKIQAQQSKNNLCFIAGEVAALLFYGDWERLDVTLTNPIFPTASLWWLSTWQTRALQRCTAILWMDSSCLAGSRIFNSSWFTRLYWNSSSSGILKLHRVKQQFLWTCMIKRGEVELKTEGSKTMEI